MSEPVFVEKSWVDKVDAALQNDASPPSSRFYDVRPAVLRTGWTWNNDELCWSCKMSFVVNGETASTRYDVYAPTFPQGQTPPVNNYSGNPRVFVVWRGRWELVAAATTKYSAGDGINITSANVIENTGVTAVQLGTTTLNGIVSLDDSDFERYTMDIRLKYPSNLIGSSNIVVTQVSSPERAQTIARNGFNVISTDGNGTVQYVDIEEGANVDYALGSNHIYFRAPPTQRLLVVTNVALNNDGTLNVTKDNVEVVVPRA